MPSFRFCTLVPVLGVQGTSAKTTLLETTLWRTPDNRRILVPFCRRCSSHQAQIAFHCLCRLPGGVVLALSMLEACFVVECAHMRVKRMQSIFLAMPSRRGAFEAPMAAPLPKESLQALFEKAFKGPIFSSEHKRTLKGDFQAYFNRQFLRTDKNNLGN